MAVNIRPAVPEDAETAAKLTFMAYHVFSYDIFGKIGEEAAHKHFEGLWKHGYNRFGYKFSYIANKDNNTVGLITCYPGQMITKLVLPTLRQLIYLGRGRFIFHFLTHLNNFYHFASSQETNEDEFYIATLSVLPEHRNMGIGAELLKFANVLAAKQDLQKCSLHVNAKNTDGIRFYEKNGFSKAKPFDKNATYFRMVHSV